MGRTYLVSILLLLYFGCEKKDTPRIYRLSKDPIQGITENPDNLIKEQENIMLNHYQNILKILHYLNM